MALSFNLTDRAIRYIVSDISICSKLKAVAHCTLHIHIVLSFTINSIRLRLPLTEMISVSGRISVLLFHAFPLLQIIICNSGKHIKNPKQNFGETILIYLSAFGIFFVTIYIKPDAISDSMLS